MILLFRYVTINNNAHGENDNAVLCAAFECDPVEYTLTVDKNGYKSYSCSIDTASDNNISIMLEAGDVKGNFDVISGNGNIDFDDFVRVLR